MEMAGLHNDTLQPDRILCWPSCYSTHWRSCTLPHTTRSRRVTRRSDWRKILWRVFQSHHSPCILFVDSSWDTSCCEIYNTLSYRTLDPPSSPLHLPTRVHIHSCAFWFDCLCLSVKNKIQNRACAHYFLFMTFKVEGTCCTWRFYRGCSPWSRASALPLEPLSALPLHPPAPASVSVLHQYLRTLL